MSSESSQPRSTTEHHPLLNTPIRLMATPGSPRIGKESQTTLFKASVPKPGALKDVGDLFQSKRARQDILTVNFGDWKRNPRVSHAAQSNEMMLSQKLLAYSDRERFNA
ncbi:snare complex subunit bet1 [Moniliophthora roreri]|nr:snare complex subunit bet1 [Moniliophthora roreri]